MSDIAISSVIPAKAGNQAFHQLSVLTAWVPVFDGMTVELLTFVD